MKGSDEYPIKLLNILLADDDKDDCFLFEEALREIPLTTSIKTVHNGEQLMPLFGKNKKKFYDVLFPDLNMPRKNGFACLQEIRLTKQLSYLIVIIFSTSFENNMADLLYKNGAHFCIHKPAGFSKLINVIQQALDFIMKKKTSVPLMENFIINNLENKS